MMLEPYPYVQCHIFIPFLFGSLGGSIIFSPLRLYTDRSIVSFVFVHIPAALYPSFTVYIVSYGASFPLGTILGWILNTWNI